MGGAGRPQKKVNLKEKNLEKFEIAAWHGSQARKVREVFVPLCVTGLSVTDFFLFQGNRVIALEYAKFCTRSLSSQVDVSIQTFQRYISLRLLIKSIVMWFEIYRQA